MYFSPNLLGVYAITENIQTTVWEICQIATVTLCLPSKDTLVLKSHFPSNFSSNLTSWLYSLIQSLVSILFTIFFAYLLSSPWYLTPYNSCQSDNMLDSWHNLSFKANRTQRLAHPWKLLYQFQPHNDSCSIPNSVKGRLYVKSQEALTKCSQLSVTEPMTWLD